MLGSRRGPRRRDRERGSGESACGAERSGRSRPPGKRAPWNLSPIGYDSSLPAVGTEARNNRNPGNPWTAKRVMFSKSTPCPPPSPASDLERDVRLLGEGDIGALKPHCAVRPRKRTDHRATDGAVVGLHHVPGFLDLYRGHRRFRMPRQAKHDGQPPRVVAFPSRLQRQPVTNLFVCRDDQHRPGGKVGVMTGRIFVMQVPLEDVRDDLLRLVRVEPNLSPTLRKRFGKPLEREKRALLPGRHKKPRLWIILIRVTLDCDHHSAS